MENFNEKGKKTEEKKNEIKKDRLKALKGKYQKPDLIDFTFNDTGTGECSDMASMMH